MADSTNPGVSSSSDFSMPEEAVRWIDATAARYPDRQAAMLPVLIS